MRFLNQRNRIYEFRHIEPYTYYTVLIFFPHEKDAKIRPLQGPRPEAPSPETDYRPYPV